MDSSVLVTNISTVTIAIITIGVFLSVWGLVINVLSKLSKLLDLKILETEIKIDKDKF